MGRLAEYRRKRRFPATPEPAGEETPKPGRRFVVQKHRARQLHYDFRLEIDGVLKSWAVPKGPSLNPSDKRLGIETEDHPIEYGDFEGVIPEGNYGAGTVMVWDRGSFEVEGEKSASEQYARGELKFQLHGQKLRGSFALVRMRRADQKNAWLLIKHRDAAADAEWDVDRHDGSALTGRSIDEIARGAVAERDTRPLTAAEVEGARRGAMPERIEPMLATLVDEPFSDPSWLFEIKWDGERALAWVKDGKVELRSRTGRSITSQYPELQALGESLRARRAVADGEIVVLDEEGRADFSRLQRRMNVEKPSPALVRECPVVYYLFDLLWCDGYDLRQATLAARKKLLREIFDVGGTIRYSDHQEQMGKELFALARQKGLEGIVGKREDSPYVAGRSAHWIKVKSTEEIDAVVGGWTEPRAGRQYFGSLLLGLYEGKALRFVGHVGTGFTSDVLKRIHDALGRIAVSRPPFAEVPETNEPAHWAKPRLIARVRYGGWTSVGRLREPVFLGLRADIEPSDCRFERPARVKSKRDVAPPFRVASDQLPHVKTEPPPAIAGHLEHGLEALDRELLHGNRETVTFDLDGKRLRLTNLSKPLFPAGYTKRDLLSYYYRVADRLLPFLRERPLVLRRYPDGVTGKSFFQKEAGEAAPEWMETVRIASKSRGREVEYFTANEVASLLYLINLGAIDQNPFACRRDDLDHPDYLIFDLDPTEKAEFASVIEAGKLVVEKLQEIGLVPFVKTSGARGIHIFVPLERVYTHEQVLTFAEIVARMVVADAPALVTFEHSVARRPAGRVYVDIFRNGRGQVVAAPYTVRPVAAASVSMPIAVRELARTLKPERYTIKNALAHLEKRADPWRDFWEQRQRLEDASERLEALAHERNQIRKS
ncbi:MAG: DNA ligase D [Acidobacteriota bacterium]|nr:DNA ligase D [Acidobacteriota bacterium]